MNRYPKTWVYGDDDLNRDTAKQISDDISTLCSVQRVIWTLRARNQHSTCSGISSRLTIPLTLLFRVSFHQSPRHEADCSCLLWAALVNVACESPVPRSIMGQPHKLTGTLSSRRPPSAIKMQIISAVIHQYRETGDTSMLYVIRETPEILDNSRYTL